MWQLIGTQTSVYYTYREEYKNVIKQKEAVRIPFYHRSPQISYRKHLIKMMKQISKNKQLSTSCLQLAVYLLDVFMDNHSIVPTGIIALANVCLLLAAKLEHTSTQIPKIDELCKNINCSPTKIKNLEIIILKFFNFSIMFPTPAYYTYYFMLEIICPEDLETKTNYRSLWYNLYTTILIYLDKIVEDVHYMQRYSASKLAAAVIAASRKKCQLDCWSVNLESLTSFPEDELTEIVDALIEESPLVCSNCPKEATN